MSELLEAAQKSSSSSSSSRATSPNGLSPASQKQQQQQAATTWVQDIFQGRLVSETRCLQCETKTTREEVFMDLSLEIDQNCSLTSCLRRFRCGMGLGRGTVMGQGRRV